MPKQDNVYPPSADWVDTAHVSSLEKYKDIYDSSVKDPDEFWAGIAKRITWYKPWKKVRNFNFKEAKIKWFESGKLNVSYNCLDRHVESGNGDRTAIIWEGNHPSEDKRFTYNELLSQVKKFANVLKNLGVVKGDRVCIYKQMVPELAIAMLACARIGAVHSVVFGAFSADSLRDRINDSTCKLLITQDTGVRGQKDNIPMKQNADNALSDTPSIQSVVVVKRTGVDINMVEGRDVWWHEQIEDADSDCDPVHMDAEDPLFILYTSGSTGKPKGVLHTTGGYLVYASYTHYIIFDYKDDDIYWCTADIGWITGILISFTDLYQTALQRLCLRASQIILTLDGSGTLLINTK